MIRTNLRTLIISIALTSALVFYSCSDNNTNPEDQAPVIPPQQSMVMDFESFPDTSGTALQKGMGPDNWGWAAVNIAFWNSVLTVTLVIPVAAFVESFNHEPELQPDGSWLWSYDVTVGGVNHTAKLYGKTVTGGVEWRMLISKDGGFTDFEWYAGFSNLPATEGTWTLNKDPNDPVAFLSIEWHRDTQNSTADIKYTNIVAGDPGNGSYIFYGKTTATTYNRFYNLFGAEANNHTDIEWNFESHIGRVKDPGHFGDESWHCWDEHLMDTTCPE